jgi:flagellar biosynthetic protein FliO
MEGGAILRSVLILLAFFAVLIAVAYAVRRWAMGSAAGVSARFRILARLPLPPKAMLYAVRIGERVFLLGVTDQTVTLLHQYDAEEWEQVGGLNPETPSSVRLFLPRQPLR